jgi:hypothetical protein
LGIGGVGIRFCKGLGIQIGREGHGGERRCDCGWVEPILFIEIVKLEAYDADSQVRSMERR